MDWFFPSFFGQVQQAVQQAAGDLLGPSYASCGTSSCSSTAAAAFAAGEMAAPVAVAGQQSGASLIIGRNLGPREGLESLIDEFKFNKVFGDKVKSLQQNGYSHWRRVRGDGNCFWRSVGFGLLEHCIASPAEQRSKICQDLIQRLSTVTYDDQSKTLAHKDLLGRLERLRSGKGWEEPKQGKPATVTMARLLYDDMQCPQNPADMALIRALRNLTACFLIDHGDDHTAATSGISFRDVSLCTGFDGIEDFVNRVVLPDGIEAETLCQAALPSALGIIVRIAMLDSEEPSNKDVQLIDYGATLEEMDSQGQVLIAKVERPLVHVQFRPGHYDLLYLPEKAGAPSSVAPAAALPVAASPMDAASSAKSEAEAKALRKKERRAAREAKRAATAATAAAAPAGAPSSVGSSSVGSSSLVSSGVGSGSLVSSGVGSTSLTSSSAGGSCFGSVRSRKSKERPSPTAAEAMGKVRLPTLGMETFENEFEVIRPLASAPQGQRPSSTTPTAASAASATAAAAAGGGRSSSKGAVTPRRKHQGACF